MDISLLHGGIPNIYNVHVHRLLLALICLHVHENETWSTSKLVLMCMLLHVLSVLIRCFSVLATKHQHTSAIDWPRYKLLICCACGAFASTYIGSFCFEVIKKSMVLKACPHWTPDAHWTGSNLVWARTHWMRIRPIWINPNPLPEVVSIRIDLDRAIARCTWGPKMAWHAHSCVEYWQWARFSGLHTVLHVSAQLEKQYDGWLK